MRALLGIRSRSCGLALVLGFWACAKAPSKSAEKTSEPAPAAITAPAQTSPTQTSPAQTLSAETSEDCTLKTPLVPGVPGSPGHLIPSERNPNGQSELSALMRSMEASLKQSRGAVARGEKVGPFSSRFRKIRCAWPTDPRDRNEQFDGFAQAYLLAVSELDGASAAQVGPAYDRVLSACRTCHESSCSGAIVAIEALRLGSAAASAPGAK